MTEGRRSRRRERSTSVRHGAPPPPLPGHVPSARAEPETAGARRRLIVTATGIAGAGLLGISLSTKAGSAHFYILTMGLAGTWAARRNQLRTPPAEHNQGPGRHAVPPRGHARAHRSGRLRALLWRRTARPAHPPAQPGHRQRPALRRRRLNTPGPGHRFRQRGVGSPEPSGLRTSSRVHPEGVAVNGRQKKELHA